MQRHQAIKDLLTERKSITVLELTNRFNTSSETIRKDLIALEKEGFCTRVHGGAYIEGGTTNEPNISLRKNTHANEKKAIGEICASIIKNGDSIFLDCSTTALEIAESLKNFRLTVLTNSLPIMKLYATMPNISLFSIGGKFDPRTLAFYGAKADMFISSFHVDKAFFSCRSIHPKFGVMDSNDLASDMRRLIISQSNQCYLCVDSSKFGPVSFMNICDFSSLYGVVTNKPINDEWRDIFNAANVTVYDHLE